MRWPSSETSAGRAAQFGIFAALAAVTGYMERMIPLPLPLPGAKLGLANVVVLLALYIAGGRAAFFVSLIRIAVLSMLFGNFSGFLYSLSGGMLSFAVMLAGQRAGVFSPVGVSVLGGVFHNLGQILIASLVLQNTMLFHTYLPALILLGVAAGFITGVAASYTLKHMKTIQSNR